MSCGFQLLNAINAQQVSIDMMSQIQQLTEELQMKQIPYSTEKER